MADVKNFNISPTHNTNKLIDNYDLFRYKLLEAARKSTIVINFNDYLQESQRQEAESINRFKVICESLSIPFQQNTTNSNEIDAIVNGHNVQFKSSTNKQFHIYNFGLCRKTNGKIRPYSISDNINFFIFEIIDEKYQNKFYIFPKQVLINEGYVSSNNTTGKFGITIAPYDYAKYHWTLQFLNRFDQLISNVNISVVHDRLHKICIDMGFICEFGEKNILISINSKRVRCVKHTKYSTISCTFSLQKQKNNKKVQFMLMIIMNL